MNNWKTTLCGALAAVLYTLQKMDLGALSTKDIALAAAFALAGYFAKDHDNHGPDASAASDTGLVLTGRAWLLLLLAGVVTLGTGCASIDQRAESTLAPDGTETRIVHSRVTALGDSKQTVEKLTTTSGKTLSAGATGANQETTSDALKSLVELLKALGATAAKP